MNTLRLAAVAAALLMALVAPTSAQNQATTFSHGPTVPVWTVGFDSTGAATTGMLNAGAGYALSWNMFPTWDGRWRRLTVSVPFYVAIPEQGEFAYRTGLTLGTLNNLLSMGAVLDMVRSEGEGQKGTGALLGNVHKSNLSFVFSFGINFGSGGAPDPSYIASASKAGQPVATNSPPNYVGL